MLNESLSTFYPRTNPPIVYTFFAQPLYYKYSNSCTTLHPHNSENCDHREISGRDQFKTVFTIRLTYIPAGGCKCCYHMYLSSKRSVIVRKLQGNYLTRFEYAEMLYTQRCYAHKNYRETTPVEFRDEKDAGKYLTDVIMLQPQKYA